MWDSVLSFGDDLVLGFKVIFCFVFATSSLLSAVLYLNCTFCPVSLLFFHTYPLLLLLAPLNLHKLKLMLVAGLRTAQGFCKSSTWHVHSIGEWRVLYWNIITVGPGTEQEMQVLFLYKHLQFELAEYLDTNSLQAGIPWVYLSSYIPVFEFNDSLIIITMVEKILICRVKETILCSISTATKETV